MNNDFSNFFKLKILHLLINKINTIGVIPPPYNITTNQLNPIVIADKIDAPFAKIEYPGQTKPNLFIEFEGVILGIGSYKSAVGATEEETILSSYFVILNEKFEPIEVNYENAIGQIVKTKILTSFNNNGVESLIPYIKKIKKDKSGFLFGVVQEKNILVVPSEINTYAIKFNDFMSQYYASFSLFFFRKIKLNDKFILKIGEEPIDYIKVVNDAIPYFELTTAQYNYFEIEENFGNPDLIDILLVVENNLNLMSVNILDEKVKRLSLVPKIRDVGHPGELFYRKNFGFGCRENNNTFEGFLVLQPQNEYINKVFISQNPNIDYDIVFGPDVKIESTSYFALAIQDIVFIDYNKIYLILNDAFIFPGPQPITYITYSINYLELSRSNDSYQDLKENIEIQTKEPQEQYQLEFIGEGLFVAISDSIRLKRVYSPENKKYIILVHLIFVTSITQTPAFGTGFLFNPSNLKNFDYVLNIDKIDYGYEEPPPIFSKNNDIFLLLKQQNMLNIYNGGSWIAPIAEPFNILKTQTTYNFGTTNSLPYFFKQYDNDLVNFNLTHVLGSKINDTSLNEIVADINFTDYTSLESNVIYVSTLNRGNMNNVENNYWFLLSESQQTLFNKEITITKSPFEEKSLNFVLNLLLKLIDKDKVNENYSGELAKIFNNKNDATILDNLFITTATIFFENETSKSFNISEYWILDEINFTLSINLLFSFKNPNNKSIKYQLISINNIIVYESEIINFDMSKLLEIKHKFYYN